MQDVATPATRQASAVPRCRARCCSPRPDRRRRSRAAPGAATASLRRRSCTARPRPKHNDHLTKPGPLWLPSRRAALTGPVVSAVPPWGRGGGVRATQNATAQSALPPLGFLNRERAQRATRGVPGMGGQGGKGRRGERHRGIAWARRPRRARRGGCGTLSGSRSDPSGGPAPLEARCSPRGRACCFHRDVCTRV